jgi:predicted  nucleic acid-binding Zn-ribbon protein
VSEPTFEERLAPLYREPPEEFVARRNELAKELRAGGDSEAAAEVRKLRKPAASAWLINRVAADHPALIRAVVEAAERLGEVQQKVLDGDEGADRLREAAETERTAAEALLAAARELAAEHRVPKTALDRAAATVQAAGSDPALRDRMLRGVVERDQQAATIGLPATAVEAGARPRSKRSSARDRARDQARGEVADLRDSLSELEARRDEGRTAVEAAEVEVRRLKLELGQVESEIRELRRRVDKAERKAR